MNTTMENSEMMEHQMENEMPEMKTANLAGNMDTEVKSISKEEAIMGLIKNQIIDLQGNIDEANITFAKAYQNDKYKQSMNTDVAKEYFKNTIGVELSPLMVNVKAEEMLKKFILDGGYDIE